MHFKMIERYKSVLQNQIKRTKLLDYYELQARFDT